jgi:hypothetical protein
MLLSLPASMQCRPKGKKHRGHYCDGLTQARLPRPTYAFELPCRILPGGFDEKLQAVGLLTINASSYEATHTEKSAPPGSSLGTLRRLFYSSQPRFSGISEE